MFNTGQYGEHSLKIKVLVRVRDNKKGPKMYEVRDNEKPVILANKKKLKIERMEPKWSIDRQTDKIHKSILIKHESCLSVCVFFSANKSHRGMTFCLKVSFGPN